MKKLVTDLKVEGKTVLVRVDFNVPHKGSTITDDNRIHAAIPTIAELLKKNAKVVLLSHLGKVDWKKLKKGEKTQADIDAQMKKNDLSIVLPALKGYLDKALGKDVKVSFSKATHGDELKAAVAALKPGDVLVMQNTRYEAGEEKNDPALAKEWASLADAFVMDAFGSAHRAHASTYGIPSVLKEEGKETAVGFLMEKEIKGLGRCVEPKEDERPYVAILGGSKVSTKIEVIDSLLKKCDKILIGGGMTYTFKKALYGIDVANSLCEPDQFDYARKCFASGKIVLSVDTVLAKGLDFDNLDKKAEDIKLLDGNVDFPAGYEGADIGPKTRELYASIIASAKTIFWNGPMGIFENPDLQEGTKAVCKACAEATERGAFTVIGGGDSAAAAKQFGYTDKFSHVSTGGGASLELIQYDGHLPGIDVIEDK
ncbi:MAG: phosphoglycerate kinase [Eubacteriales bacterium]|nr:phosphoglycerate kinase [Eubacteriales bacterium]